MSAAAATSLAAQVGASAATGLLMGFSHCLGMCGPLVASFGLSARPGARRRPARPGRRRGSSPTTSAASPPTAPLGAVMGATGAFVNVAGRLAGLGEVMALLAGALMVALGLGAAGVTARLAGSRPAPPAGCCCCSGRCCRAARPASTRSAWRSVSSPAASPGPSSSAPPPRAL